jgi:hypothetical protein
VTPDYFDALIETEQLLVPAKQEQKDFRVGFLYATIESVLGFGGLVLLNMPPAYFDPVRMLFAQYRRTVHGFYLDVPEAVVHARLLRRGAGEEEARMKMRLTADWRDQAKALGFTLIENPEEDDHYPHQALEAVLKKLGTTTELIPVAQLEGPANTCSPGLTFSTAIFPARVASRRPGARMLFSSRCGRGECARGVRFA